MRWPVALSNVVALAAGVGIAGVWTATFLAPPPPRATPTSTSSSVVSQEGPSWDSPALQTIAARMPEPTATPAPTKTPAPTVTSGIGLCGVGTAAGQVCRWPQPPAPTATPYPPCGTPIPDRLCRWQERPTP